MKRSQKSKYAKHTRPKKSRSHTAKTDQTGQGRVAKRRAEEAPSQARALTNLLEKEGAEGMPQALQQLQAGGPAAAIAWLRAQSPAAGAHALSESFIELALRVQRAHPQAALTLAEAAIEEQPESAEAWLLWGGVQDRLGQRHAAAQAAQRVIQSTQATPEQRLRAAHLLSRFDRHGVALQAAREAYKQLGQPLEWATALLYMAQRMADWTTTEALTRQMQAAYARGEGQRLRETPRTHLNWCGDEALNLDLLKARRARLIPIPDTALLPPPALVAGRRLRIGYLSSDFREHPTARLIQGLLRHHDRQAHEILAYCSGWDDGSPLRAQLKAHVDHWYSVAQLADAEAAALMRAHRLDVLVELNGPTRANRLGILAHRPAPVQIGYLGWPGSYGGGLVDYLVADAYVIPPERTALYPETLIRLAHTYQVNDYAARPRPPRPSRQSVGLPSDACLVLGMFNAISKVNQTVWSAWMRILHAVPNAVLWILEPGPGAVPQLAQATQAEGVALERIIRAPRCPQEAHLARLQCCDLILDPWPCGGHTSTSDALFAGVPVVALEGTNFAGRVSGSLLHAAGLGVFVQPDVEAYVRFAVTLLSGSPDLARARTFLAETVPAADVFNAASKTRQLERAYRRAFERYLAVQPESPSHPPADWASEMLVLDPGLKASPGHHQALDEAVVDAAQANGWRWQLLAHETAFFNRPVTRCFRCPGGYVSRRHWLDWQYRSSHLAMLFAADLAAFVTPRLTADRPSDTPLPGLLLPTATLPLLLGLVQWLEGLPDSLRLPRIGLHFHAPPDFGSPANPMAAHWVKDMVQRLVRLSATGNIRMPLFTVEHPAGVQPWLAAGLPHAVLAPSPHAWHAASRQRPLDARMRLLFIGAPRLGKGIQELVTALPTLLQEIPELDLRLVLVLEDDQQRPVFEALANERVQVRLGGHLPSAAFYQEIADADAVYCAYRPRNYGHMSSGIFQEAQALGIPALVCAGTGAAQDLAASRGQGAVVMPNLAVPSLVAGCRMLLERLDTLRQEAQHVSTRYARNRSGRFWFELHSRDVTVVNIIDDKRQPRFSMVIDGRLLGPHQRKDWTARHASGIPIARQAAIQSAEVGMLERAEPPAVDQLKTPVVRGLPAAASPTIGGGHHE